jgi:hypothetical protein
MLVHMWWCQFFVSQGGLPLVSIFVWFMTEVNGSTDFFPSMSAILVWFFMILIIIFSFLLLLLWIVVLYSRVELFTSLHDRNRRVKFTGLSFFKFLRTWNLLVCSGVYCCVPRGFPKNSRDMANCNYSPNVVLFLRATLSIRAICV